MPVTRDLTHYTFGRLYVVAKHSENLYKRASKPSGYTAWQCKCECGATVIVISRSLISGKSSSCGCLRLQNTVRRSYVHGHAIQGKKHPLYQTWVNMKSRCSNSRLPGYDYYGGRGITVCDRWKDSFTNFLADMGERPEGMSIDRIDNDGNYEPSNCRWTTPSVQVNNRRTIEKRAR